jgi:hypothetical protein
MTESVKPRGRAWRAALLSATLVMAAGGAANAQNFGRTFFDDDILPPRVIAWRLADRGFTDLSRPRFDGRFYVVDAVSPAGRPVRLLLDPMNGAIVGGNRAPQGEIYAGLEGPPVGTRPGFGWTEDDVARPRPLPPEAAPAARLPRRPGAEAAPSPEGNPLGLNPDAPHRAEPPRKVARTSPTKTPDRSAARVSPPAPAPKIAPEAAQPSNAAPAAKAAPEPAPAAPVAQAAPKPDWKDPPPEGKRPVRVIGGATVVPGTSDKGDASKP